MHLKVRRTIVPVGPFGHAEAIHDLAHSAREARKNKWKQPPRRRRDLPFGVSPASTHLRATGSLVFKLGAMLQPAAPRSFKGASDRSLGDFCICDRFSTPAVFNWTESEYDKISEIPVRAYHRVNAIWW